MNNDDANHAGENTSKQHVNAGADHFKHGDFAAAESEFLQAIEAWPANSTAHRNLGLVLSRMGRTEEALARVETALKLEPCHAGAREFLAQLKQGKSRRRSRIIATVFILLTVLLLFLGMHPFSVAGLILYSCAGISLLWLVHSLVLENRFSLLAFGAVFFVSAGVSALFTPHRGATTFRSQDVISNGRFGTQWSVKQEPTTYAPIWSDSERVILPGVFRRVGVVVLLSLGAGLLFGPNIVRSANTAPNPEISSPPGGT